MKKDVPILLVDDDDVDTETVVRAFKNNKVVNPLFTVGNGKQALDFLKNQGDFSDSTIFLRPGLILLDLQMPVMNGIEFLEIVKADEDLKKIPIVVLTTSVEEKDRVESYSLHVAGYIVKPVNFGGFNEAIKAINYYWALCEIAD
jgi:CheY-like chemotaxis protein